MNIVQKILKSHIVEGEGKSGENIGIKIDQTLTQDATGTMAYLEFEAMEIPEIKTEVSVSYVDHNTSQMGFENNDDHKYLQTIAEKYGINYSRAGNGICHQVHLERFGLPGKTLLGSDSHTPTGGGIGMMAIGAGGLDVACALAGLPFHISYPKVLKINLQNKLSEWVTAKDIILYVLELLSTKGNVGWIVEYGGEGVKTLTVPERATITNMGAELGVTTSIFPSDELTYDFLKAQGREDGWIELKADDDAEYDRIIDIDLSKLEPRFATPHSPGNISLVRELAGKKVDQVAVGSCTNSSYKDLMTVAKMVEGKKVHPNVSFGVAPGSKQVLRMISENGALADLISFGARIMESACGFCIGNGYAPSTDAVSIRTNNRNFKGRSGTVSASVYLASPETAVACAIAGVITDPRELGMEVPKIDEVEKFTIDDSMIISAKKDRKEIEIFRGPNIGDPPKGKPLSEKITGEVTLKIGDKITTDHIMPAGIRLKYRSNIPKYSEFVFEPVDSTFPNRCLENKEKNRANIIVAGLSYGQGSSREHAAICPAFLGVKVVIAKSIERIHYSNLINFGILPLEFVNEDDFEKIDEKDELELSDIINTLENKSPIIIGNKTKNTKIELKYALTDRDIEIIKLGGLLSHIKVNK
ncbi:MAG: aconitate hydratase [Candidatus Marinimicrobia bacterium]|nr:aconitate hydratase [Candidatus Neomarinimicrobiota bacterium]